MTVTQKELIKATVPILKEHGLLLTTHFYNRMFQHNPELKNMFNMGNQQNKKQQTALAMAVLAYAEHIENPSVLLPVIDSIGQKHTSLDIRPEHYLIVGKHLIASISEVLGAGATPDILGAWTMAYNQLAQLMSGHESNLYQQQIEKKGGWTGWRPFIVEKKIKESEEITSFYLYPADKGPVADFQPGQYLSIRLFLPELNLRQPRQYSLSCAPNGQYYRISVKKEKGSHHPDGMISNRLHDFVQEGEVIDVSSPAGNFTLKQDNKPAVFISGGVGQTPLMAMLESLVQRNNTAPVTWVHGCRNESVHAFKQTIATWAQKYNNIRNYFFYEKEETRNIHHFEGRVALDRIADEVIAHDADYYICGPAPFIEVHYKFLIANGINKTAIHFEEFGPASLQLN